MIKITACSLKQAFKEFRFDLTNLLVFADGGGYFKSSEFDISPEEFLSYAKIDFQQGNQHGMINSLTNAKRAIDSQIDSVFKIFDIDFDKNKRQIEIFINLFSFNAELSSLKLRVIQALDLAPSFLISKVRTLRNKLEHYYKIPTSGDVLEAIEIADLFIRSIKYKLISIDDAFHLIDRSKLNLEQFNSSYIHVNKSILLRYFENERKFIVSYNPSEDRPFDDSCRAVYPVDINFEITSTVPEYYGLIKLMLSTRDINECQNSLKIILTLIEHEMPLDKLRVELL